MPRYSCSVEWIVPSAGVVRIHEGPSGEVGAPYVWAATLDRFGTRAAIKGVDRPLPPGSIRPLYDELHRQGMRLMAYERRDGAAVRFVRKPIRAPREMSPTGDAA